MQGSKVSARRYIPNVVFFLKMLSDLSTKIHLNLVLVFVCVSMSVHVLEMGIYMIQK